MKPFQTLGAQIEERWRAADYNEDVFPAIAEEALAAADLPGKIPAWDVIEWTLREKNLPDQRDLPGRFGDPPITLFNAARFHVDVYFWLEGTTSIHQHNFCGAFQVLHGSSIHSHYTFEPIDRVNVFTEIGTMSLQTVEYLAVGKVRRIRAGRQYIHGLFHLEQPSATIVVRTHKSPLALPQFDYYKPSLAVDPFFQDPNATKKLQCLTALIRAKHPDADRLIGEWLETADFQTTFIILSNLRGYLQSDRLAQMFAPGAAQNRFERFLEIVRKRHGARAEVFPKVFAHLAKVGEIINRRGYVADSEQRFFLALLMNVEGRARIFSLIKERFPNADPIEKILDWTFDLANARVLGANPPNALGIADFGTLDLFILENLLKDKSEAEMRENLRAEHAAEDYEKLAADLPEKTARLRQSAIFEPLLQTA